MKLLLLADDLTGALDSSVAFAERGFAVHCALTPAHAGAVLDQNPEVAAISTNTREASEKEALCSLEKIVSEARQHPLWKEATLFKKVDSRLKGHVAAEVALLGRLHRKMLVCPAIPRLGRLVKNGAVCGAGVAAPIPVAEKAGCRPDDVVNAGADSDLDNAVAAAQGGTLYVGAAGLAEALARKFAPAVVQGPAPEIPGPALFAIGSRDPVTTAQLEGLTILSAPNGDVPASGPAGHFLEVIRMTDGPAPLDSSSAGARFAKGISRRLLRDRPASLLACGGETAAAIARQIGCGMLRVEGEVLPGLPVSTLLDGQPGLTLITKSGGFGPPDTLVKLAEKLVVSPAEDFEKRHSI